MTETAVERVARAIGDAFTSQQDRIMREALNPSRSGLTSTVDDTLLVCARAALEALREPTPEMVAVTAVRTEPASAEDYAIAMKAAVLLPPSEHPDVADVLAELARDWRAMIDSSLRTQE